MKKLVYSLLLLIPLVIVGCGTTTAGDMTAPMIQGVVVSPEAVAPGGYVKVALRASDSQGNILSYKVGNGASHLYTNGTAVVVQAQAASGSQDIDIYVGNGRLDARAKGTIQVDGALPASTLRSGRVVLPINKSYDFFDAAIKNQYFGDLDYRDNYYYGNSLDFSGNHNGGTTYTFDGGLVNLSYVDKNITELGQICEKYTGDYHSLGVMSNEYRDDESTIKPGNVYCFVLWRSVDKYFGKLIIEEINNTEIVFNYVFQLAPNETRFYDVGFAASLPSPTGESGRGFSDGAEEGMGKWLMGGFTTSTVRSANGSNSFYSGRGDDLNNVMTLATPVIIAEGDKLTFNAYYQTESSYDYLYVQASIDGETWTTLAGYDGSNLSWSRKELSLSAYSGRLIFIRFKYATDSSVDYEGVYIDDISIE